MPISDLQRVTVRLPKADVAELAERVDEGHYPNRSEAIRTAVATLLDECESATSTQSPPTEDRHRRRRRRRRRQRALTDGGQPAHNASKSESESESESKSKGRPDTPFHTSLGDSDSPDERSVSSSDISIDSLPTEIIVGLRGFDIRDRQDGESA